MGRFSFLSRSIGSGGLKLLLDDGVAFVSPLDWLVALFNGVFSNVKVFADGLSDGGGVLIDVFVFLLFRSIICFNKLNWPDFSSSFSTFDPVASGVVVAKYDFVVVGDDSELGDGFFKPIQFFNFETTLLLDGELFC